MLTYIHTFYKDILNVYSVCFHPQKSTFAGVGSLPVIFVCDAETLSCQIYQIHDKGPLYSVLFLENHLITTGENGNVYVFDNSFHLEATLLPFAPTPTPNFSLSASPDNKTLLVGSKDGFVYHYEIGTWKELNKIKAHEASVRTIKYSQNGNVFATGGSDRMVYFFDALNESKLFEVTGHGGSVFSVVFSSDGALFATGGQDARIRLWNVQNQGTLIQPRVKLLQHSFAIKSLCFLNRKNALLSVSQDKTIKQLNIETSEIITLVSVRQLHHHSFTINSISLSMNESYAVTGSDDKSIKLWKID